MRHLSVFLSQHHKLRLGLIIVLGLISLGLVLAGVVVLRAALAPSAATFTTITPAQPDEFLILVAPFQHQGGEQYPFGAELANDLRQTPHYAGDYRVENLTSTPDDDAMIELAQTYHARAIVTGRYDESAVDVQIAFFPPEALPRFADAQDGQTLLLSDLRPQRYQVYAPRGLGHPLQYLQYWLIGQSHFWRGDADRALRAFELAQRLLPTVTPVDRRAEMDRFTSSLLWGLGYISGPVRGDWPVARDFFYRALTLDPESLSATLGLAAALAHLDQPDRAIDLLQAALRANPDAWQIYFALAEIKAQQGEKEAALALYEQTISLLAAKTDPASQQALADVYVARGYYYYQLGDYASALADFEQARALGRNDVYLLSNLGWTAYLLGDYDTAVAASTEAAALAPDRPDLAFNKGLHLLAAGRYDEARAAYDQAIQLTLRYDDVVTRSTYFGMAYQDLTELAARRPDLQAIISEIQQKIDIANG